jgi:hypothetical protein
MVGFRTRISLAQFLELQDPAVCIALLTKYDVRHVSLAYAHMLQGLLNLSRDLDERTLMLILAEIATTRGDLRARVNPKYRFDERLHDLKQCLLLDGYAFEESKIVQVDPAITDAASLEDDLVAALKHSGAPRALEIIAKIADSAQAFRATPPDYNAALVNARLALETLAGDVAIDVAAQLSSPASYDPSKWGEVIALLRRGGEISAEEEKGLVGVFGF